MAETNFSETLLQTETSVILTSTTSDLNPSSNVTVEAFQNLYPAILECFTVILLGYMAGRTRLVCPSQARGLGYYVTYFALPALLFKSMVELNFRQVNWLFWVGVLISKAIVFTVVYIGTLLLKGSSGLGKAGLYSMFATQSNDFALGFPIVKALYSSCYPEFIQYIYIFAPISLVFLNPWAFLSLEVQKNSKSEERSTKCRVVWSIFKGLISNPIFTTVIAGIIFNFIFGQHLPATLDSILTSLGDSFAATALFLLGINMVGKVKQQKGMALLPSALLIASKLFLLPLVTNQVVSALQPGHKNDTLSDAYASFGYLYGTIPTAPSVFIYATHYQESVDMIAPAMVYCTFVAGPLMFITATMVMIPEATEDQYHKALSQGAFDVSCIGLASAIWVFIIFLLRRKIRHLPHQFTTNLIVAQAFAACGVIVCHVTHISSFWPRLIQFVVLLTGVFGARCWTAMVALSLFLLRYRSTCFVWRHRFWFYLYGWGIPIIVVGVLVIVIPIADESVDFLYEIEKQQLIASVVILVLNLVVSMVSLFALHRLDRFRRPDYQKVPGCDSMDPEQEPHAKVNMSCTVNGKGLLDKGPDSDGTSESSSCTSPLADIEDLTDLNRNVNRQMCGPKFRCPQHRRMMCRRMLLRRNLDELRHLEEDDAALDEAETHQLGRHIILLYLLNLSIIIAISLCVWKLLDISQSGIFLELSFLDCILNFGQGFLVLAIFGFDTQNVIMPIVRLFRKCIYGTEKVHLPRQNELSPEVLQTCEQFRMHHLARCRDVIVSDLNYHLKKYKRVFVGSVLVDWLLEVGLAEERSEATTYAGRLLLGQVLEHVHQEHHFHDTRLFYRFLDDEEEEGGSNDSTDSQDEFVNIDDERTKEFTRSIMS